MANAIYTSIRALTIEMQSNRYPGDMAGSLAPVRAVISAGSSVDSQIPALALSDMNGSNGAVAVVSASAPAMTADMGTAPALSGNLGVITGELAGWSSYPAAMASLLPRLQVAGVAHTGTQAILAASLSPVGVNLLATAHPVGSLVARMMPLQIDGEALAGHPGGIGVVLPRMIARFTGYSGLYDELEIDLPALEIHGEILSECSFDLRYTRGRVR